jgi:hypothetical protein
MLRSPLCQSGMSQGQSRSSVHGQPRRRGYALPVKPSRIGAARTQWARVEALLRNRAFANEYASARERWRDGAAAVFPPGTYWLQRFAAVPVMET